MKLSTNRRFLVVVILSAVSWYPAAAQDQPTPAEPKPTALSRLRNDFQSRDVDGSGDLSLEEFVAKLQAEQHSRLKRDFSVVDFNRDDRLSFDEFAALPGLPINDRGTVPDPLQIWADDRLLTWRKLLQTQDKNQDGGLAETEWPGDVLKEWGPIGEVSFAAWDVDRNGTVTAAEAQQVIEWAYGIRRSDGTQLRLHTGGVVDLMVLAYFDTDKDGVISLAEFSSKYGTDSAAAAKLFNQCDRNQNGFWEWDEVLSGAIIITDTLGLFLSSDTNLNGFVDQIELNAKAPEWQKRLLPRLVAAFDDDADGQLSLAEYRTTPVANLLADWFANRMDINDDEMLSFSEFYTPAASQSPAFLVQFAYEQFRRWDRNHDGRLTIEEYEIKFLPPKTPRDEFRRRDRDRNGTLSFEEFVTNQPTDQHSKLKRDFGVVDFNRDEQLSWDEFRTLIGGPLGDRGPVPDPLQAWADEQLLAWRKLLPTHDKNQDDGLSEAEWPSEMLKGWGPIGEVPFAVWDADRNGVVSAAEAQQVIEWSYGIRWSNGSLLRLPNGGVADLMALGNFDANRDGVLVRVEFVEKYWLDAEKNGELFTKRDLNGDGRLDWTEIMASPELVSDTLGNFLYLDKNLDGLIDQSELDERSQGWQKRLTAKLVAPFDDDGNGGLSLAEYRQTPIANHSTNWYSAGQDRDYDGKLSLPEFYVAADGQSPAYLMQFAYEQFRRWDRNHDGKLSSDEFEFTAAPPKTIRDDFLHRDVDRSGNLTLEEFWTLQPENQRPRLKRDFGIVDFNRDNGLSWDEFCALPNVPFGERGPVPDPLQNLVVQKIQDWRLLLLVNDQDHNGGLSRKEWPHEELRKWGPLGEIPYVTWDADFNDVVTATEAQQMVERACGIRRSNGMPLRLPTGFVADLMLSAYLDANKDGVITFADIRAKSNDGSEKALDEFNRRDRNQNKQWDWDEIANDNVSMFLYYDANLDGLVDQSEVDTKAQAWQKKLVRRMVTAFDDDGNGKLSLAEFRMTPVANLAADWFSLREDRDFDGKLSFSEFYSPAKGESPAYLTQLAFEQFRRWDRDRDGGLSSDEHDFTTNTNNITKLTDPVLVFRVSDKNHDGFLTSEEVFVDPNPDPKNTGAVMDFHRRKMRSGEAFFSADKNRDRRLSLDEYRYYREILEQVGTKPRTAAPIPPRVVSRDWGEILAYSITGLNIALALIGGLYWAWHRKGKLK